MLRLAVPLPRCLLSANVRGDVLVAGWVLESDSDGSSCTATYISQLRYGAMLPIQTDVRSAFFPLNHLLFVCVCPA